MEGGLPILNCLLQCTLRSFCSCSGSSDSSKWVYAVFWRILPRHYPPPKWDCEGGILDRSRGNRRNWILVWEDGYCDFCECERAGNDYIKGRFGTDVFFKMSHEVYNYGEGLVGKVAADNSHKWVYRENTDDNDATFIPSWSISLDPQPRAWEVQFNSGIQTIALISVREGIVQLGSFDKIEEDLNLVMNIQRKFSYIQSMPGNFAMQRPYHPIQFPNPTIQMIGNIDSGLLIDNKYQLTGSKRSQDENVEPHNKSINLGWNSPRNGTAGPPVWHIPPLLPPVAGSHADLSTKLPFMMPHCNPIEVQDKDVRNIQPLCKSNSNSLPRNDETSGAAAESSVVHVVHKETKSAILPDEQEHKPSPVNNNGGFNGKMGVELGFELFRKEECT